MPQDMTALLARPSPNDPPVCKPWVTWEFLAGVNFRIEIVRPVRRLRGIRASSSGSAHGAYSTVEKDASIDPVPKADEQSSNLPSTS